MSDKPAWEQKRAPKRWILAPLFVWAGLACGPSLIAAVLSQGIPAEKRPALTLLTRLAVQSALWSLPFGLLFLFVWWSASRNPTRVSSIRMRMWVFLILMSLPNLLLFFVTPSELLSGDQRAGQGTAMLGAFFVYPLVALLGVVGCFAVSRPSGYAAKAAPETLDDQGRLL